MVQNEFKLFKVVILGPESTGKSTLCEMLAQHFDTFWCPEFAREYLLTHGRQYDFNDLLDIARGQVALEEEYVQMLLGQRGSSRSHLLLIDTDQYVMKVWCEYVFGDCHNWILRRIAERRYDLYLLCKPDLPWVQDELREYPDEKPRQQLYHLYRDLLIHQKVPWVEISGGYEERTEKGIAAIDTLLQQKKS